jgi:hypothetical protein
VQFTASNGQHKQLCTELEIKQVAGFCTAFEAAILAKIHPLKSGLDSSPESPTIAFVTSPTKGSSHSYRRTASSGKEDL